MTINYYGMICFIFELRPLHYWEVKFQDFPHNWVLPKVTLNGSILILHVGLQRDKPSELKLLQSYHCSHVRRGQERFRIFRNLQKPLKENGRWNRHILETYV